MAKPQAVKKTVDADQSVEALRTRVEAILHSNGFDGTKAAGEIAAAVSEHIGADLAPAPKADTTEEEKLD